MCATLVMRVNGKVVILQWYYVEFLKSRFYCMLAFIMNVIEYKVFSKIILLLLLLLKNVNSARLGESDIHPISPKTPAPQYQPIDRKKRKGKRVEDYSRDRAA